MASDFQLQKLNYVSKDFVTLRDEMLSQIPVITKGRWTNLNESDPGITILELTSSMVDNLLFYQDMVANELYMPTVRQRLNVLRLLKLIGYEIQGARASTGTATFATSPGETPAFPVIIKANTELSATTTGDPISFLTRNDVTLTSLTDTKTVEIIQGTLTSDTFISDGNPDQRYQLSSTNIDKTTVKVFVDTNLEDDTLGTTAWTRVDSFFESNNRSTHFKTEFDGVSRLSIIFGDGQFGQIPGRNAQITVTYIVTAGANGNVGKNAITRIVSGTPFVEDNKNFGVKLSVLNSAATAGGADVEDIEQAKATALGLLFGLNRALSRDDFASLMLSVPGVDKAVAWGENEELNPDYRLMNKVRVSFFSKNFADLYTNPASRASYRSLRDNQVRSLLTKKMPITTRLAFVDPVLIDIFVSLQIGIDINRYDENIVVDKIRFAITDAYSIDNVSFGQDVRLSDILKLAEDVEGVTWARILRLHTSPPPQSVKDVDLAPERPVDLILDKWKLPTFTDTTYIVQETPAVAQAPYLRVIFPPFSQPGPVDIVIENPDGQTDIQSAATSTFTYFPGSNLQHILIQVSYDVDEPTPSGGFFGHPDPETDYTTFNAVG